MVKVKFPASLIVFMVFCMLLVSACSGTQSTSEQPSQSPSSSNSGKTDSAAEQKPDAQSKPAEEAKPPIKIGVLMPFSGVYAPMGTTTTNGLKMYFDEIGWEIEGRKVELINEDTEVNPQTALRKFRKLVDQDKVDLLVGPVSSAVAYALRDEIETKKIPLLIPVAGANGLTGSRKSDYIWRLSFSSWQVASPMGKWAYDNVAKEAYVTAPDYAAGKEMVNAFIETFTAAGGKIIGETYPPLGNNDYASFLTQIKNAKPGVVFAFYAGSDSVRFVKQYEQYGLKGEIPLVGTGWLNDEDVRPQQGTAPEGVMATMYWDYHLDTAENKKFVKDYEGKYKVRPTVESVVGYDIAKAVDEAVKKMKGDTSDKTKFSAAFSGLEFVSPRGPIKLDPENHNVVQNIYVTKTSKQGDTTENEIVDNIGIVRDPGH